MKQVRFGVIGLGMMGRAFASAVTAWAELLYPPSRPVIRAVCSRSLDPEVVRWFQTNHPSLETVTDDWREVLADPDVDAVYCAVPNHLHREVYTAAIEAGKHLMGEKPFGIDREANSRILASAAAYPDRFVRCCSQWFFYPGMQRIGRLIEDGELGRIIEVETGFLHSSDLDPHKPINWKRRVEENGRYGCMGDLGMHVCALPFRAGWRPANVRALLADIVRERPDGSGNTVPCTTWDNATLLCETVPADGGAPFPMTVRTHRIAPGETNTLYLSVLGTRASARFTTRAPDQLQLLRYTGGAQSWQTVEVKHDVVFPTVTAPIFESGHFDAFLQMWAAFLDELEAGHRRSRFSGCVTPEETELSHRLFTAALISQAEGGVAEV